MNASLAALIAASVASTSQGQSLQPAIRPGPSRIQDSKPRVGPDRVNWWNDRVFYQIFVRSFADSKTGPLAGDGIGDFQGLIERLDYLNDGNPDTTTDLGIGGICLMSINPSPSDHGYDVTDHFGINPQYGTIDDFRRLLAECHKRGLKVIIDLVMNHVSNQHEWFKDAGDPKSSRRDWFIWSDADPGWKGPWGQRVWHPLAPGGPVASTSYYYGVFSPAMPDLNFRNTAVGESMKAVTFSWLSNYGVDGFRLNAAGHLIEEGQVQENTPATHEWLRKWFLEFRGMNLDAVSIGDVGASGGSQQASSYVGDQMDMAFEFSLADAMITSVNAGTKDALVAAQKSVLALYPPNQYGRFLSSPDQTRVYTQLKSDSGAIRTAAALLLTGPGVPFIYYGEEIGMTGNKPDGSLGTPMQWTAGDHAGFTTGKPWAALKAGFEALNVERQSADADSLLNWYRTLIGLRNGNPALATGGTWLVETDKPEVIAWVRHRVTRFRVEAGPDARGAQSRPRIDSVLVIINLSDRPVEGCTLGLESSPLRGELAAQDSLGSARFPPVVLDARGGFKGYQPGLMKPRAAAVLVLSPG